MPTDTDVLVATLSKNAREDLRVTATTYEGIDLLDVRCWTKPASPTGGECKPTKKVLPIIAAAVEEGP